MDVGGPDPGGKQQQLVREEVHWDVHQGKAVREGLQTGQGSDHMKPGGMHPRVCSLGQRCAFVNYNINSASLPQQCLYDSALDRETSVDK